MEASGIMLEASRGYRSRPPQPVSFLGPLGRLLFGDTRGTSCRPGLRARVVSPNYPAPPGATVKAPSIRDSNFTSAGWKLESASRVPRPPRLATRKPRPHAVSLRAGRARLVRPWTLLPAAPAACAAGDCLLLARKSTRHISVSRGMQGRRRHLD